MPIESITWIDRTDGQGRTIQALGRTLVNLGSLTKADAVRTYGADKVIFLEGSLDRSVLRELFALHFKSIGQPNPFDDLNTNTIVACLPNGKGDVPHLPAFSRFLQETLKIKLKIAAIVDRDYDKNDFGEPGSDVLLRILGRKEVENYLLDADVVTRAASEMATRRAERLGSEPITPDRKEIEQKIAELSADQEIKNTVRYQFLIAYQRGLPKSKDEPKRLRLAEERFDKDWSNPEWRIENCPGKEVLAKIRRWIQQHYSVSLTDRSLIAAMRECPSDIAKIASDIHDYFCG